ncbi:hypothetical protein SAICODRAFT_196105 [Saitoella complicata NRRL Y-17804]|nr:uncharacterized protein SAICODRAFT_196105 [Saitoella complicata NRRL Y-17804]ODQ54899.1 hypothetical protein SAICODRAFT_196105 [Saitoella complicata NRRL Y-17804]
MASIRLAWRLRVNNSGNPHHITWEQCQQISKYMTSLGSVIQHHHARDRNPHPTPKMNGWTTFGSAEAAEKALAEIHTLALGAESQSTDASASEPAPAPASSPKHPNFQLEFQRAEASLTAATLISVLQNAWRTVPKLSAEAREAEAKGKGHASSYHFIKHKTARLDGFDGFGGQGCLSAVLEKQGEICRDMEGEKIGREEREEKEL